MFHNYPVREKQALAVLEATQMYQVKQRLMPLAIAFPSLTISLYGTNHQRLFFLPEVSDTSLIPRNVELLRLVHGTSVAKTWDNINAKSSNSSASATFIREPSFSKASQYIVINGHRLLDSPLYSTVNKAFANAGFGSKADDSGPRYPVYIINVKFPVSVKDYVLDPQRAIYSNDVSVQMSACHCTNQ